MMKINQAAYVCLGAFDFTDALTGSGLPSQSQIIMRKLPSPGFQVEVVLVDYDGALPQRAPKPTTNTESNESPTATASRETSASDNQNEPASADKDGVFSDSDSESSKSRRAKTAGNEDGASKEDEPSDTKESIEETSSVAHNVEQLSLKKEGDSNGANAPELRREEKSKSSLALETSELESTSRSEFKAIAADASVFFL